MEESNLHHSFIVEKTLNYKKKFHGLDGIDN
jgi:hypothetical protein